MAATDLLAEQGDGAEEAGDFALARRSFEEGAALGDEVCLTRLAYMFDVGKGVEIDKQHAMGLYRQAWRRWRSQVAAASNIAILYREAGNVRAMFRWFARGV